MKGVRGIKLTDYFKMRNAEPFEDSTELECLIGDLITQPQNVSHSHEKPEYEENKEQDRQFSRGQGNSNKNTHIITEQLEQLERAEEKQRRVVSTNKKALMTFRESQLGAELEARVEAQYQPQTDLKLEKLTSLEFRSSSIKVYKSQKMRIRQVSNSPYQRELSKPKDLKVLHGAYCVQNGSTTLMPSIQRHQQIEVGSLQGQIQKYFRNVSPLPKEEKAMVNLRHIKHLKELEREGDAKQKRVDVYNTLHAYSKKIRDQQKHKQHL